MSSHLLELESRKGRGQKYRDNIVVKLLRTYIWCPSLAGQHREVASVPCGIKTNLQRSIDGKEAVRMTPGVYPTEAQVKETLRFKGATVRRVI